MKKLFLFLLYISIIFSTKAQNFGELGSPFITNYMAIDYGANNQNWSILQDKRGIMYFGNTNGVLEFDGKTWKVITTETNSIVRTLDIDTNSTIFVGGNATFGYLTPNKLGETNYKSLVNKLPEDKKDFTDIRKLCTTSHGSYFFTKNDIFHYVNDTINVIPFTAASLFAFTVKDVVFAVSNEGGIYAFIDGKKSFLPGTFSITENSGRILIIEYDDNNLMIITENNGIIIYNISNFYNQKTKKYDFDNINAKQDFYSFENELQTYFNTNKIYCGIQLDEQNFAVGTVYGGLVIFDKTGKVKQVINKNRGLLDEAVISIYLDRDNNLWLAQLQGIAYIHYNNPLTKFQEEEGIEGSVYSIIRFKDLIFAGTSIGMFYLQNHELNVKDDKTTFKFVEGTLDRVWDFLVIDNNLIAASSGSIMKIKDTLLIDNYDLKDNYTIYKSPLFENKLFIGRTEGFAVIDYKVDNNNIEFTNLYNFDSIKSPIREINSFQNSLWLTSSYDGVFQIKFEDNIFENFKVEHYDTLKGLPGMSYNSVLKYNDNFFLGTNKGDYILNSNNMFEKTNIFGTSILDSLGISDILVDNEKLWILTSGSLFGYLEKKDTSYILNRVGLIKLMGYSIYNIYLDDQKIFWLSTNKGVFRYDTRKEIKLDKPYKTLLRKIIIGKDSIIFNGAFPYEKQIKNKTFYQFSDIQDKKNIPILNYKSNSIIFDFSSTFYENNENNFYSYYLEGFEKEWNTWTNQNSKEYSYLREGHYTFHLKSKNIYGIESEITIYSFYVKPPWYRTIIAYIIYLILSASFIIIIVKLNTRRLKALNQRLEKIITERTAEISLKNQRLEQQKEEIVAQSEQLEHTNKELEKLSIVASETDNAVLIMDAKGTLEWANEGFSRLYGFTLTEFINIYGNNILTVSSNNYVKGSVENCLKIKKSVIYESQFKTKNDEIIWLQTTLTPILDKNDEVIKLIAIESDIRKLKEYESDILQKNEEINSQKDELEIKSKLLEEHNENIKASIRYAKTIQNAILPFQENIDRLFDNFILYLPKDIVSGDFYWFSHYCKTKNMNSTTFFAVVDCTGHGVPGAFMSMIGSRLLNEIVNEKKIFDTAKILTYLQKGVQKALRQNQTDNHDGMDICLAKIEESENLEYLISYTGAKRPLYYLDNSFGEIQELKADRMSIGGVNYTKEKEFTVQTINLLKNDLIYFSTDGFIDQNNIERKRLGSKTFVEYLNKIYDSKIEEQGGLLTSFLNNWMGTANQRDDITVVGLKLK